MPYNMLQLTSILLILHHVYALESLIETKVGSIKGLKASDGDYTMFLGIPYAKVQLDNPFGPATPNPKFNEPFHAYDDSAKCPQMDGSDKTPVGTLDCLHLSIHVPDSANSNSLLPVMVYIHGGSFNKGSGENNVYGAKFLVRHDVILVTLNYRVGVYGFMCLGTVEVPGNQGLKDQLLALKWINSNIKEFGGDPDKVTLFGESAGARSVDFHLMADDQNLFNKAIEQSGNSICSPPVGEFDIELPMALANNLGIKADNFRQAVQLLSTVDPKLLVKSAYEIGFIPKPCVEMKLDGVESFVTDYTINRDVPKVRKIPILMGFNNNERYFFHAPRNDSDYKELNLFGEFLEKYFALDEMQYAQSEKLVRQFYIGDEEVSVAVKQELADFDSDFTYIHPTHRRLAQFMSNSAMKIYLYMFSYRGERNFNSKDYNVTGPGAVHADELAYLFNRVDRHAEPTLDDFVMIDRMTTMWTNFAKYGDPTPETSDLLPVKWEPVTDSRLYYYSINSKLSLEQRPFNHRMTFLDLLFKMNEKFQKGLRH